MPDVPNHGRMVLLIECAPHIIVEKPPVLLLLIQYAEEAHCMYTSLNTRFHPSFQMLDYTYGL